MLKYALSLCILTGILISCDHSNKQSDQIVQNQAHDSVDVTDVSQSVTINSVEDIKAEYTRIVANLGSMDSTFFKYECSEKQGTVIFYQHDGNLQLIRHQFSEAGHYSGVDAYYVRNDSLFFAFYDRLSWSFAGGQTNGISNTKDDITEQRFYIIDGKLEQCLQKEFTILSARADNPQSEDVPNSRVDCDQMASPLKEFSKLIQYRNNDKKIKCL